MGHIRANSVGRQSEIKPQWSMLLFYHVFYHADLLEVSPREGKIFALIFSPRAGNVHQLCEVSYSFGRIWRYMYLELNSVWNALFCMLSACLFVCLFVCLLVCRKLAVKHAERKPYVFFIYYWHKLIDIKHGVSFIISSCFAAYSIIISGARRKQRKGGGGGGRLYLWTVLNFETPSLRTNSHMLILYLGLLWFHCY